MATLQVVWWVARPEAGNVPCLRISPGDFSRTVPACLVMDQQCRRHSLLHRFNYAHLTQW